MQKINFVFPLILSIAFSCQEEDEVMSNLAQENSLINTELDTSAVDVNESNDNEFADYIRTINSISLPVSLSCEVEYLNTFNQKNIDDSFAPPGGSSPVKIINDKELNLIIYHFAADIYFPILYSYDKDGHMIDSLLLLNGMCNGDPYYNSNCFTQIDKKLKFTLVDTVKHFSLINEYEDRILDSITIEKEQYTLNTKGEFELVNRKISKVND